MPVKFGQTSIRFWLFLSYLITTVLVFVFYHGICCEKSLLCLDEKKMAHHRALLASSVMTDYLWMRMITPCIIDPEIPKARRGLTVKGQAICKESSIRFPSGRVVLIWMEQGTSEGAGGFPKRQSESISST